jgi:hypothetical protein
MRAKFSLTIALFSVIAMPFTIASAQSAIVLSIQGEVYSPKNLHRKQMIRDGTRFSGKQDSRVILEYDWAVNDNEHCFALLSIPGFPRESPYRWVAFKRRSPCIVQGEMANLLQEGVGTVIRGARFSGSSHPDEKSPVQDFETEIDGWWQTSQGTVIRLSQQTLEIQDEDLSEVFEIDSETEFVGVTRDDVKDQEVYVIHVKRSPQSAVRVAKQIKLIPRP